MSCKNAHQYQKLLSYWPASLFFFVLSYFQHIFCFVFCASCMKDDQISTFVKSQKIQRFDCIGFDVYFTAICGTMTIQQCTWQMVASWIEGWLHGALSVDVRLLILVVTIEVNLLLPLLLLLTSNRNGLNIGTFHTSDAVNCIKLLFDKMAQQEPPAQQVDFPFDYQHWMQQQRRRQRWRQRQQRKQ